MSQYFLAVNHGPADDARMSQMSSDKMQAVYASVEAFNEDLRTEGAWVFAGGLQSVESSTVVDNTGAQPILTDGPYAESKEYLGGFWVIEAADLDAALAWAKKGSKACDGKVEVRPFQDEFDA